MPSWWNFHRNLWIYIPKRSQGQASLKKVIAGIIYCNVRPYVAKYSGDLNYQQLMILIRVRSSNWNYKGNIPTSSDWRWWSIEREGGREYVNGNPEQSLQTVQCWVLTMELYLWLWQDQFRPRDWLKSNLKLMKTLKSAISIYFTFQCETDLLRTLLLDILDVLTTKIIFNFLQTRKSIIRIKFLENTSKCLSSRNYKNENTVIWKPKESWNSFISVINLSWNTPRGEF